jgi:hypothetical protein
LFPKWAVFYAVEPVDPVPRHFFAVGALSGEAASGGSYSLAAMDKVQWQFPI